MKKNEFIEMMRQDLETHPNKNQLIPVLECMKEILKRYPIDTEIDTQKAVEDCFNQIKEHARKKQQNGCYYFTPQESTDFIAAYLGVEKVKQDCRVDLEDFL